MPSNYSAIKADNERRYGTDIGRIGQMLLADRYDDRTHFIFELLQNAEDALARRPEWAGSRSVTFDLLPTELRFSHFGKPFDERDVRGVCGIAESTKDFTAIGRFGIGFKSVYSFTERPEIHSGDEDFSIERFVLPMAAPLVDRRPDETVIVLPFGEDRYDDRTKIAHGLKRVGLRTLMFLRQIKEIRWSVPGGHFGRFLRDELEQLGEDIRRIRLLGDEVGQEAIEETWLLFSTEAKTDSGEFAGLVEIAFAVETDFDTGDWSVKPLSESPLVVFFPTVVPTHLGFLVQGPYRTTPSRDNVPRSDPWNQQLVELTASLLLRALRWMRDEGLLDTAALRSLPLDRGKFGEWTMFAPLFNNVRAALTSEQLLPTHDGAHAAASSARLARTQELRDLFDAKQLAGLLGIPGDVAWLTSDISQDRTPELRQYLMTELRVAEVTPDSVIPRLTRVFLEAQPDEWINRLYEFLNGQPALVRQGKLKDIPLVRLEDGRHVTATKDGKPQAFLPSPIKTDFPTVRRQVCEGAGARKLLDALGLTEPEPVDDVIWNILPRYPDKPVYVSPEQYSADIGRFLTAFGTDSKAQRQKLVSALRATPFVKAVKSGSSTKYIAKPSQVYPASQRMKDLFEGVPDVLVVDDTYECLKGEAVRELLEACGTSRTLQPVPVTTGFTPQELRDMRHAAGCESCTSQDPVEDATLRGLDKFLLTLPTFDAATRRRKASLLWEALGELQERRGTGAFSGSYSWTYVHRRYTTFDAAFVNHLNQVAWVPDAEGDLHEPSALGFDTLGWKPDPFLLSKIHFKPPIIDQLAKAVGIEPGVLDLLKKLGVTSEAELKTRLGVEDLPETGEDADADNAGTLDDAVRKLLGDSAKPEPTGEYDSEPVPKGSPRGGSRTGNDAGAPGSQSKGSGSSRGSGEGRRRTATRASPASGNGSRPFISYVGAHLEDDDEDPDGLDHEARMALESQAIDLIISWEPDLRRTSIGNPGFDLVELDDDEQPVRWVEVKAMTGTLNDRPVGLSRTQFEHATNHGHAYWLYVVEQAGDGGEARVVRIQDPAGRSRTFTFDHGWLAVAVVDADLRVEQE